MPKKGRGKGEPGVPVVQQRSMKHLSLVIDNNVVLDHLLQRQPHCVPSRRACLLGLVGEAATYISANMVTDIYYLLRKAHGSIEAQRIIQEDLSFLNIVGISPADVSWALAQQWSDLEDCLVSRCAQKVQADYVVTRNCKDFVKSAIPAISPEDLFGLYASHGIDFAEVPW